MLLNTTTIISIIAILLFITPTSAADNICDRIKSNPEVLTYFAQNQVKKTKIATGEITIGGSGGHGTCQNDGVWLNNGSERNINYECSSNGCAMGRTASLVKFENDIYVLTHHNDFGTLVNLRGWNALHDQEKKIIKLKNLVGTIYKLFPDKGRLISQCESIEWLPKQEELLYVHQYSPDQISDESQRFHRNKRVRRRCFQMMNGQSQSIFPAVAYSQRKMKPFQPIEALTKKGLRLRISEYNTDLRTLVKWDLFGDRALESIAIVDGSSGAGCGCSIKTVALLDENHESIVPANNLEKEVFTFTQSLNCGEKIDIVHFGDIYFEKTSTYGTRELFNKNDLDTPLCVYVNNPEHINYENGLAN